MLYSNTFPDDAPAPLDGFQMPSNELLLAYGRAMFLFQLLEVELIKTFGYDPNDPTLNLRDMFYENRHHPLMQQPKLKQALVRAKVQRNWAVHHLFVSGIDPRFALTRLSQMADFFQSLYDRVIEAGQGDGC